MPVSVPIMRLSISPTLLSVLLRLSANAFAPTLRASPPHTLFLVRSLVGRSRSGMVPSSSLTFSPWSNSIYNLRGGSASRSISSTSSSELNMSAERPFVTWTFDKHCETMGWSPAPAATLSAVSVAVGDGSVGDADLVIVGVFAPPAMDDDKDDNADEKKEMDPIVFSGKAKELDETLGGALTELASDNSKAFQNGGSAGTLTPAMRVVSSGGGRARRYVLLGLGPVGKEKDGVIPKVESATIMKAASAVASACHDQKKVRSCSVLLPPEIVEGITSTGMLTDFSTAFFSSLYVDNRYRTGKKVEVKAEDVESVKLYLELSGEVDVAPDYDAAISSGAAVAMGCSLTKDIVNAPHNVLNSESLADTARRVAEESGGSITCEILGKEECEARGMGAYLGVARGSETEPQFIHLTYRPPNGDVKKKVGCVGKGLLFDTGGYNIKTSMMELMKFDCGGAAAVLGAARAIGSLKPDGVEAHFIVAACENMISAKAFVPSDILTASNNKTIEILNTDAEGRLTLADALVFADKECGCEKIIELSTLTGACMVSLGTKICGVWTDDDGLAKEIEDISKATGDKSWRMPLAKEYADQLKSKIADISNLGGPYGGAITAALFLTEFVDKKKPFAHIDIAGPVWDKEKGEATGFGAKLVAEWVRQQGQ